MKIKNELLGSIGFFLIALILFIYLKNKDDLLLNDLEIYEGNLSVPARVISHGGETEYNYVLIKLSGFDKEFHFQGCSFYQLNRDSTLAISVGSKLSIGVSEEWNGYFKAVSLRLDDHKLDLLRLESFNSCNTNTWKIWFIILIVAFLILIRSVWIYIKFIRDKN